MTRQRKYKIHNTVYLKKLLEEEKNKHKKSKKNIKKKNLAKEILVRILETTGALDELLPSIRSCQSAYLRGGYELIAEIEDIKERKYLKDELRRLKKKRFLRERKIGNRLELYLTEEGEQAALRYQIVNSKKMLKNRYLIVIFDIPESERNVRDFFRQFIKEAGFVKLQQSVWLTEKDILESLTKLIRVTESEKWIQIITAIAVSGWDKNKKCARGHLKK